MRRRGNTTDTLELMPRYGINAVKGSSASFFLVPKFFNWPKLVGLGLCLWLVLGFGACTIQAYLAQPEYIRLSSHALEVLK